ncbi:hypothetical protein KOR42_45070 [Thalassoglobus neptunius]|uniref:CopG-like ribbon-helix-helix domain-containing protein n=1 Tax=Thalassoglobus neptunius TaxID=1938619 RepID=A0A5C5VY35_9PLAN|nr:hypothetical protein [Thalassoglobus neptunius]TWT43047.1 hypothetical protein KOR42_45070 [Thalassoglobus neptunius]
MAPQPLEVRVPVTVKLPALLKREVQNAAKQQGQTMMEYLVEAARKRLDEEKLEGSVRTRSP